MPSHRITCGEHAWVVEYDLVPVNGLTTLQLLKIRGALTPLERPYHFCKALAPLWFALKLPADAALVMHPDLIRFFAEADPGSQRTQSER